MHFMQSGTPYYILLYRCWKILLHNILNLSIIDVIALKLCLLGGKNGNKWGNIPNTWFGPHMPHLMSNDAYDIKILHKSILPNLVSKEALVPQLYSLWVRFDLRNCFRMT
jgi:hypothetical protein